MIEIVFTGLFLFAQIDGGRRVVMPEVTNDIQVVTKSHGTQTVEAHEAYIEVAAADVIADDDWPFTTDPSGVWRWYAIDRPQLALSGLGGAFVEPETWRRSIPAITATCPSFQLPESPATGTVLDLQSGTLAAAKQPGSDAWITTLTAQVTGDAIRIQASDQDTTKTLTLRQNTTRISFRNRFKGQRDGKQPKEDNHWLAYYSLAAPPPVCDLPNMDHPMLRAAVRPDLSQRPGRRRLAEPETTIACSISRYP